jgi:hypothetical protein
VPIEYNSAHGSRLAFEFSTILKNSIESFYMIRMKSLSVSIERGFVRAKIAISLLLK